MTIQAPLTITAPRLAPRHLSHLLLLAFTATAVLTTNHLVAFLSAGSRFALTWPIQQGAVTSEERLQYLAARPVLVTLPGMTESVTAAAIQVESPPLRHETVTYTVQPGDTLSTVAIRFGLSWETVSWANDLPNVNALRIGQELTLPPIDSYPYTVKNGDILTTIAQRYKSDAAEIVAANNLPSPDAIFIGQRLWLPGGRPLPPPVPVAVVAPAPALVVAAAPVVESAAPVASRSGFVRPLIGLLTQYFGYGHEGVDIARPSGTPIQAAAGGQVVDARKLGYSYGWYLMIDHGNGYKTMYAHLSEFLVDYGQWVEAGQVIGRVGVTGRSTGPHLHFELHLNGSPVNPLNYLP